MRPWINSILKFLLVLHAAGFAVANAQTIASFDMTGNTGAVVSQSPAFVTTGVTVSNLTRSTGLNSASGTDVFSSTAWNTTNTLNLSDDYLSLTVSPNSGFQITFDKITLKVSGSSTAPATLTLAYSNNGFSTSTQAGTYTITGSLVNTTWDFSNFTTVVGTSTEFRIYAYGTTSVSSGAASTTSGSVRFDDIIINGTASAIPEPSTYAAILGATALASIALCRRRLKPV